MARYFFPDFGDVNSSTETIDSGGKARGRRPALMRGAAARPLLDDRGTFIPPRAGARRPHGSKTIFVIGCTSQIVGMSSL